jgi:glycerol-3-phosphate dehydrogenase
LSGNYPYIDAEVTYACREYACTIEDVLSRRTRLAFLNKDAAFAALPRVADLMAQELGWSLDIKQEQMTAASLYLESYGGRIPNKAAAHLKEATYKSVRDIFEAIDTDQSGFLDRTEVVEIAAILGMPLTEQQLSAAFKTMDASQDGRVHLEEFEAWWNEFEKYGSSESGAGGKASSSMEDARELQAILSQTLRIGGQEQQELKKMGPGTLLG